MTEQPVYRISVTLSFSVCPMPDVPDFNPEAYARELIRDGCPLAELSDVGLPAARIEAVAVTPASPASDRPAVA
ncbi:MAG TPA: hypothetical protein VFD32_12640 [Dehalococcoidia bacterium]|nr:hypothetical protein [Dehalococcoidia bacterium]